jgi:nitrate reductase NapD|tara:strand:+ start:1362 stop:1682 length:321 start_codon:yes stop_codon:yes gene_type:complete
MKVAPGTSEKLSRRDVMKARFSCSNDHIASLLVQAWPKQIPDLIPQINALHGTEVHHIDKKGQMVVTIEVESDHKLLDAISDIEQADGVITVSLVYHQIEDGQDER